MHCKAMITVKVEENNPVTQEIYDEAINSLEFHSLSCTCGHSGSLRIHGYYRRMVKNRHEKPCLKILRVRCACCGHTHAVLLSSMVPYSQIRLKDQVDMIKAYESGISPEDVLKTSSTLDESNFRHVVRQYLKHWKQKLISESIGLLPVTALVTKCLHIFLSQFMQIRPAPNLLYVNTT